MQIRYIVILGTSFNYIIPKTLLLLSLLATPFYILQKSTFLRVLYYT